MVLPRHNIHSEFKEQNDEKVRTEVTVRQHNVTGYESPEQFAQ